MKLLLHGPLISTIVFPSIHYNTATQLPALPTARFRALSINGCGIREWWPQKWSQGIKFRYVARSNCEKIMSHNICWQDFGKCQRGNLQNAWVITRQRQATQWRAQLVKDVKSIYHCRQVQYRYKLFPWCVVHKKKDECVLTREIVTLIII
jgi:hypothetical protein